MRKTQTTRTNTFLLLESLYFVRKNILEYLVYTATFVLQFFHVEGY